MVQGWAVQLNETLLIDTCGDETTLCPEPENVVEGLTDTPDGLGLPGLRTEDVTFPQRDGVQHFSDRYLPRFVTLRATIGPADDCSDCDTNAVRRDVRNLIESWKRQDCNCDTELVIFTPCSDHVYDEFPTPELVTDRINHVFNSRGQEYTENCGVFEFTENRGFAGAPGSYSQYEETLDLPALIPTPQDVARKTWNGPVEGLCADFPMCFDKCFDIVTPGSNDGAGFMMGCTGTNAFPVTEGDMWTLSGYMRSSIDDINVLVRVFFYDADGSLVAGEDGDVTNLDAETWTRIWHTVTVPAGVSTMMWALDTGDGGTPFSGGDTLDATGALAEMTGVLDDYFDGDYPDTDDPQLGGIKVVYDWEGEPFESFAHERTYEYVPGPDRALNGPFGVVGRPRVAEYKWLRHERDIADVLLRFDAVDHRLYLLDQCGTPGVYDCATIDPGVTRLAMCFPVCFDTPSGTACFDQELGTSVDPTTIQVLGTETAYPIITFTPGLTNPRLQDLTTGKSVNYRTSVNAGDQPVIVDTSTGRAFQGNVEVTGLVDGQLDFTLTPGEHDLRLVSQGLSDDGDVQICWRPAVVAI